MDACAAKRIPLTFPCTQNPNRSTYALPTSSQTREALKELKMEGVSKVMNMANGVDACVAGWQQQRIMRFHVSVHGEPEKIHATQRQLDETRDARGETS